MNSSTPGLVRPNPSQNNGTAELTFQPKVRGLPPGIYGTSRTEGGTPGRGGGAGEESFDERSSRTIMEREQKLSQKRQFAAEREMDGEHVCSKLLCYSSSLSQNIY